MLPTSQQNTFAEWWTSSQVDILVRGNPWLVKDSEKMTPDGFGNTSQGQLTLFSQPSASSKTSGDTSQKGYLRSSNRWKEWVTECIGEYSQRRKQAQATREKEFLSWRSGEVKWTTPTASDQNRSTQYQQGGTALSLQVKSWGTPTSRDYKDAGDNVNYQKVAAKGKLSGQVQWPTPTTAEANKIPNQANYGQKGLSNHPAIVGETNREKLKKDRKGQSQDPASLNTNGNAQEPQQVNGRLNPAWVAQLMGTSFEKIFFVHLETQSTQIPPQ